MIETLFKINVKSYDWISDFSLRLHPGYIRDPFLSTIFENIGAFDYMPVT
jgi:hypothetical protein